jgi:Spy/CpxP family protein refolding chaperone
MAELIEQLQLTAEQQQRLDRIHEALGDFHGGSHDPMVELHNELMSQFESGYIENAEIRRVIDEHVEQIRETAYVVTDELVGLVNALDERQRGIVQEHLDAARDRDHGHGH